MGKAAIREMEIRQGLVLGLLLLASCQGFRPAEQEVVQLADELGASMANSTNATAKTEAPKPPEPKSAKEGELMSYMKTVREVMRLKGHDPSDDEIKLLAGHLMEIDETAKDTPKMSAIEKKLQQAKAEFAQAVSTEKKLKNIPDEKTAKEYGLHDEDSWGPPKAAAKPAAAKPAAAKPSA